MTKNEILRDWEEAKDKKEQIQILADLNCTSPEEIKNILIELGVDYRRLPREKKREKAAEAAEAPKAQPKKKAEVKTPEAPKHEKPKVEPRRKHALRRMEQLLQAVVTQEMADDIPDEEWVEELHDLWTDYYYKYWGDTDE